LLQADLTQKDAQSQRKEKIPHVEVLILNFNGRRRLKTCLDSVLATHYPNLCVVLVDNGSTDGSVDFVRKNYPSIKIIANKRNLGFAKGYSSAVRISHAPYLVFLNNDVEVDKNWLRELICCLEEPNVAATTSKLLFFDDRKKINACGGIMDKYGCSLNRGNGELDLGQYDKIEEVFYAVGAAMAVKRSVLNKVGFFDEDYFSYWEDVDWSWRARLLGYKILYVPSSVVYHKWRGSLKGAINLRHIYNLERYRLATLLKNFSFKTLFFLIPRFVLLEGLKILWILVNWSPVESAVVVKALLWNLTHLGTTLKKRYIVQRKRKLGDADIFKKVISKSLELHGVINKNSFLSKHPLLANAE